MHHFIRKRTVLAVVNLDPGQTIWDATAKGFRVRKQRRAAVVPAVWLAGQPWAALRDFWYLSVASLTVQAVFAVALLRHQLHHKLKLFGAAV